VIVLKGSENREMVASNKPKQKCRDCGREYLPTTDSEKFVGKCRCCIDRWSKAEDYATNHCYECGGEFSEQNPCMMGIDRTCGAHSSSFHGLCWMRYEARQKFSGLEFGKKVVQ